MFFLDLLPFYNLNASETRQRPSERGVQPSTKMPVTLTAETADCPLDVRSVLLKPELSDVQISVLGSEKVRAWCTV